MSTGIGSELRPAVSEFVQRVEGRDAQSVCISASRALADVVRTTLGPRGLDKMLVGSDGKVVVTNDGAGILDRLDIEHPIANLVVTVASQQEDCSGDGTTTAVVLTGELLAEAEDLLERGVHPTTITEGYHRAARRAVETLDRDAIGIDTDDAERLEAVARTVITGRWDAASTAFLAARAVETVRAIADGGRIDFDRISRKTAPSGSVFDSQVFEGLIIDMDSSSTDVVSPEPGPPDRIEDATVALIDDRLTVETVDGLGTVSLDSPEHRQAFRQYEDDVYAHQVARIANSGADVVFCQKSIDRPVRYLLAKEGILAVERTRQDELHKLGRATGARPVATVDELTPAATGTAPVVERREVGARQFTFVRGGEGFEQVSLLLRGGTEHVVEETKRIVDDCVHVLKHAIEEGTVVPGGGATEVHLSRELREYAAEVPGREQLAIVAFADALETIPWTLAASAGVDPIDSLVELRARHHGGESAAGLDLETGAVEDMVAHGVLEPASVKQRVVLGATEAAIMLLRVDDIVAASGDRIDGHDHDHDHGHGGQVEESGGYPWTIGH
jgi:thermosome